MNNKVILPNEIINHILSFRPTHPIINSSFKTHIKFYNFTYGDVTSCMYDENKSFSKYILSIISYIRIRPIHPISEHLKNTIRKYELKSDELNSSSYRTFSEYTLANVIHKIRMKKTEKHMQKLKLNKL
jgi:hypothetical protein